MILGLGGLKSLYRFLGGINRLFREFLLGENDLLGEFFKSWGDFSPQTLKKIAENTFFSQQNLRKNDLSPPPPRKSKKCHEPLHLKIHSAATEASRHDARYLLITYERRTSII